jgi:hypothetical protein
MGGGRACPLVVHRESLRARDGARPRPTIGRQPRRARARHTALRMSRSCSASIAPQGVALRQQAMRGLESAPVTRAASSARGACASVIPRRLSTDRERRANGTPVLDNHLIDPRVVIGYLRRKRGATLSHVFHAVNRNCTRAACDSPIWDTAFRASCCWARGPRSARARDGGGPDGRARAKGAGPL